jgi:alanine-glyoxylate transaminase/serine-glyoxylate transaminase/serine-pyruvate transaminase
VKQVLKTRTGEVVMFPATGTAGWEAAITNTLSPGDKVLACRHGMFSHRWIDMCKRHGLDVVQLNAAWGAGAPAADFARPRPTCRNCERATSAPWPS